jgi:hypothetical protein
MKLTKLIFVFGLLFILSTISFAQTPKVGKKAAGEYLSKKPETVEVEDSESSGSTANMLMLHLGAYTASQAYEWNKSGREDGVGHANYGMTYLYTDWHNFDLNLRAEFSEFKVGTNEDRALKFSMLPLITFPRAESKFPIYFGFGAGLGIFFQQAKDESNLSFDYQLVVGSRFMDIWANTGLFVEYGMKNHLLVLTDGQLNGTVLSAGAVFTF